MLSGKFCWRIKKIQGFELGAYVFIALIVLIGTFPDIEWSYSTGSDQSLCWLFNYLFKNNPSLGKGIIFPHGPLAFFNYPLPENIILVIIVHSLLKLLIVVNLYWLVNDEIKIRKWIIVGGIAYIFPIIASFNTLILINILLLYCNYFNLKKNSFKYIAFFLTAIAFFIKAYIAIITGLIFISFSAFWFYKSKNSKQLLIDCLCLLALMQFIWILLYKSVAGFATYIWGMYNLAQDNSSAVSYYPYNNWWILFLFFLLLGTFFMLNRTKRTLFYLMLIALGLFAAWKHGMAREDFSHAHGFFLYLMSCLLVFILFQRNKMYINIILSIGILGLFSINRRFAITNIPFNYDFFKGDAFMDFVLHFPKLKNDLENTSKKNIAKNKLPADIRAIISNSTVDIYPWDYTIIAANQLNLKPRPVIQSYASYTHWLDAQNATHFNSNEAPDFLIWDLKKMVSNINGAEMYSIDDRYLLNDEPQTMLQILKNYDYFYSDEKFQIYKKRNHSLDIINQRIGHTALNWSQWTNIPDVNKNILRAKLNFDKTTFQWIKSFLYKDEQFWIYLLLKNGEIHKYRIVPKNASDGIWIMPYIFNPTTAYAVEKIMFKCSMQNWLTDKIEIDWEEVKLKNPAEHVMNFFHLNEFTEDSLSVMSTDSFLGSKSYLLKSKTKVLSFAIPLDSVVHTNLKIAADFWVKAPGYIFRNKVSLVLSVEDKNGKISWKSAPIDRQLIDENQWNNIYNFLAYKNEVANRVLKIVAYNDSNQDVFIDQFRLMIMKGKPSE